MMSEDSSFQTIEDSTIVTRLPPREELEEVQVPCLSMSSSASGNQILKEKCSEGYHIPSANSTFRTCSSSEVIDYEDMYFDSSDTTPTFSASKDCFKEVIFSLIDGFAGETNFQGSTYTETENGDNIPNDVKCEFNLPEIEDTNNTHQEEEAKEADELEDWSEILENLTLSGDAVDDHYRSTCSYKSGDGYIKEKKEAQNGDPEGRSNGSFSVKERQPIYNGSVI